MNRILSPPAGTFDSMIIDCNTCLMRGSDACGDCVVSCLLSTGPAELSDEAVDAIGHLADAGLVPKLRLVPAPPGRPGPGRRPMTDTG